MKVTVSKPAKELAFPPAQGKTLLLQIKTQRKTVSFSFAKRIFTAFKHLTYHEQD